jgi:hypothetical protein
MVMHEGAMTSSTLLSGLLVLATAGSNVHALVVALLARRAAPATLRRRAWRCGISVVMVLALTLLLLAMSWRDGFAATDPSQKATRIANAISEAINCGAFAMLGCALPIAVTVWLAGKAARASRR